MCCENCCYIASRDESVEVALEAHDRWLDGLSGRTDGAEQDIQALYERLAVLEQARWGRFVPGDD